jgi:hypothetical protein
LKKKNCLKWSPGSQDIEVLKSAIFQGFFRGRRCDFFFFFSVVAGGRIFSKKLHILVPLTISPNFKNKNQPKWSPGSEVMNILNSTVFQGFFGKHRDFLQ